VEPLRGKSGLVEVEMADSAEKKVGSPGGGFRSTRHLKNQGRAPDD